MGKTKQNFIYNSIYNIISILIPLITTPYISRMIGAEGLGNYAYAYSIASYFSMFIKLGLNNYGSREIAYCRGDRQLLSKKFWEIYALQFGLAIISISIYTLYCIMFSSIVDICMILIFTVIASGIDITWFYWGVEEFQLTVRRDFIVRVLTVICIFVFIKDINDGWKYALILSTSSFISQVLLWPTLKRYVYWIRPNCKGILKHFMPNFILFIPAVAVSLYKIMDKIMLGLMASTTEVGYYQSSESIIQIPMALITSLGTVMQPRMCNIIASKNDIHEIEEIFNKSVLLSIFLSTSLGFGIMTVSREFVPIFYGNGFEKCHLLYRILLPSCMFMSFANVVRTQILIPYRRDVQYTVSLFTGAIVNLLANLYLIYRLQSVGVAIGTLLAEMTVCLMQVVFGLKILNLRKSIIKSIPFVLSGIAMYMIFGNMNLGQGYFPLIKKIVLSGFFYLICLFIMCFIFDKVFPSELKYKNILKDLMKGIRKK